jgi:hypothetical protein
MGVLSDRPSPLIALKKQKIADETASATKQCEGKAQIGRTVVQGIAWPC